MRTTHFVWLTIIEAIKRDAEKKDYVVDFLTQDDTCYVYFKDDDQSAIYALNDQHRAQLVDSMSLIKPEEVEDAAEAVADFFWSELNEHYRLTK